MEDAVGHLVHGRTTGSTLTRTGSAGPDRGPGWTAPTVTTSAESGIPTASCIYLARAGHDGDAHPSPDAIRAVTTARNDPERPGLMRGSPAGRVLPASLNGVLRPRWPHGRFRAPGSQIGQSVAVMRAGRGLR